VNPPWSGACRAEMMGTYRRSTGDSAADRMEQAVTTFVGRSADTVRLSERTSLDSRAAHRTSRLRRQP